MSTVYIYRECINCQSYAYCDKYRRDDFSMSKIDDCFKLHLKYLNQNVEFIKK